MYMNISMNISKRLDVLSRKLAIHVLGVNPYHSDQFCIRNQWFMNRLSNQIWAGLPRLGLTEDARITDYRLGLLVLIFIRMTSPRQL